MNDEMVKLLEEYSKMRQSLYEMELAIAEKAAKDGTDWRAIANKNMLLGMRVYWRIHNCTWGRAKEAVKRYCK